MDSSIIIEKILYFVISLLVLSIFVWLAIRVKRHPERDNIMQREMKKQKGDEYEKGAQKCLIFGYLFIGVSLVLFRWLDKLVEVPSILTLTVALGLVSLIAVWRYTGEFYKWVFIALAALLFLGIGYHIWAFQSSKVEVLPDKLSIKGSYNPKIPYQDIDSVFVVNELPETEYCRHDNILFPVKRGVYRLENIPDATFYVLGKEGPYLMMYTMYTYPNLIIVNRKTSAETEQLIEELKDKIGDKMK